jgi:hypothetical protein
MIWLLLKPPGKRSLASCCGVHGTAFALVKRMDVEHSGYDGWNLRILLFLGQS